MLIGRRAELGFALVWCVLGDGAVFAQSVIRQGGEFQVNRITVNNKNDGDGIVGPLTDGLLFLRYLFGFRGATFIQGAVGVDCVTCTGPEVAAYLDVL